MRLRTLLDVDNRDERHKQLAVLGAAFTLTVLSEELFDLVDGLAEYLALLLGGTGALFLLREGIDQAWKGARRRRAERRARQ